MKINMVNFFGSDQIKSVQNGSKRIKLDQTGVSHISTNVTIKCYHICHENKHGQLFWIRSDQIRSKWIKLDYLNLNFSHINKKDDKIVPGVPGVPAHRSINLQSAANPDCPVYPVYPNNPLYCLSSLKLSILSRLSSL